VPMPTQVERFWTLPQQEFTGSAAVKVRRVIPARGRGVHVHGPPVPPACRWRPRRLPRHPRQRHRDGGRGRGPGSRVHPPCSSNGGLAR
jgi:hypothetical protein